MRVHRSILAFCGAASLAGCSLLGSDPLDDARLAFEAQDYIAAHDLVMAALAEDAEDLQALELLARIQLAMGQGGDVDETLDRFERAGGDTADQSLVAAEGLLQVGEVDEAIALIGDADTAEAWRLRALAAGLENDAVGARAAFRRGRSAAGDRGRLFSAEASYHLANSDLRAAAEAVALAQDVAPGRIETLFVSARLAEAQGNHALALSNYLRIIEKVPLDRPALLSAIAASERANAPGITRYLIAYGAQTRPMDREFIYQQARVDGWDGRWQAVRERLQAHEAELAGHDPARTLYAESLAQLGQVETARAMLAPVLARRPGDPEARRVLATIEAAGQAS